MYRPLLFTIFSKIGENSIGAEAVDNAPLLYVIWGHFYLYAVTGENPDAVYSHASC